MGTAVVDGATVMCTFATGPATLKVSSQMDAYDDGKPLATIVDCGPMNIPPFLQCTAPTNPAVIAALGAPSACTRVPVGVWTTSSKFLINNQPNLSSDGNCHCGYGGLISIVNPGTATLLP